ncbi:MAG: WG repeat-containing protein [Nostoc sp.]|uniref:WG repeat-containing protein n=1 Tax=Nostoc sp. TaxID=1180 RepID=UPI002FF303B5
MIGRTLRQHYKIIDKLGSGGFGETYLAEDLDIPTNPKPKCVVKRLQPNERNGDIPNSDILRLFQKEGEILYQLSQSHNQIPKLYAYFEEKQEFYLVQEFIDGHDLSQEIALGKVWNETRIIEFLEEILKTLAFLHQNHVIHRDIKPSNIMRRKCDDKLILIDFGFVKTMSVSGLLTSTIAIGSQGYAPAEQAIGIPKFSSDIYALGMTAIQALTGNHPMKLDKDDNDEIIWQNRAQVSDALAEILTKMVRYNFRDRYASASEALQALTFTVVNLLPSIADWLKPIKIYRKWGYIHRKTKEVLIQPQFDDALEFCGGLAAVEIDKQWGYIDKNGRIIIQPQFEWAWFFAEGLAEISVNCKSGYIDTTGKIIIQPQFEEAKFFSEGLAAVRIGGKFGYINIKGEFIIQPQFDEAECFYNGLASVEIGGEGYCIDKTGNFID